MASPQPLNVLAGIFLTVLIYYAYRRRRRSGLPLPPGPTGYPIIGNVIGFPSEEWWIKFHELSKEFKSDIVHISLAGQSVLVLDSLEAVTDLLEKRSSIYSDRPPIPMLGDLMQFGFLNPLARYGDEWRDQRKLMHRVFSPGVVGNFERHALRAAHSILRRFLDKPGDLAGNIYHLSGEVTLGVAYGLDVQPEDDPYLSTLEELAYMVSTAAKPGANMVDVFPILKYMPGWMPGAGFQARVKKGRELAKKSLELPFRAAKILLCDSGNFIPSFISYSYSAISEGSTKDLERQEYLMKGTAASLYIAGTDTIAGAITYCIAAPVNNPNIVKRAQQEIDAIIPSGEMPTFGDREKLPFITALVMEVLRWKDLLPLSLPHFLMEDDTYKGYRLPKGSIVMGNSWAILHDEAAYPDPFSFKPERFLNGDGKIDERVRDPSLAAFGYGRRICPGRYVALRTLWITVASILASFDIKVTGGGKKPNEGEPGDDALDGVLRHPKPFPCSITPRSEKHAQAIRATLNEEYF